ncbi:hypothetical protein ACHAQJ_005686 [Trichoderma viride]
MGTPKPGLINHYKNARYLLELWQGEPEVELICMLALTVGATSDMVIYEAPRGGPKGDGAGFAIASSRPKRGAAGAALLAIHMLWYLKPDTFVWKKARGPEKEVEEATMYSTQYVRQKTVQYKITNNLIAALGWLQSSDRYKNARSVALRIASKEVLWT